jgi:hypothetical protein
VLTSEQSPPKKEKASPIEKGKGTPSLKDSLKARFSDPPAPPPQAPLPEKPDVTLQRTGSGLGVAFSPASLNRTDTEKPRLVSANSSPVKPMSNGSESLASAAQIANLVESLTKTKQEVDAQSARLREVEDLLVQERVRREDAEERAKRLERERKMPEVQKLQLPSPLSKDEESSTPIEDENQVESRSDDQAESKKLQERLDLVLIEFNEFKVSAERWKQEKEQAEKERDEERKERLTLAEMVEQLRAQEVERVEKEKKKEAKRGRRRSRSASAEKHEANGTTKTKEQDIVEGDVNTTLREFSPESKPSFEQNGHPLVHQKHPQGSDQSDTRAALAQRGAHLAQAAPYLSAMSVVLIGVAVMALINKMQSGESVKG